MMNLDLNKFDRMLADLNQNSNKKNTLGVFNTFGRDTLKQGGIILSTILLGKALVDFSNVTTLFSNKGGNSRNNNRRRY